MELFIYDCEIQRCIPDDDMDSEFDYCSGWDDFENMGIACVGFLHLTYQGSFLAPTFTTSIGNVLPFDDDSFPEYFSENVSPDAYVIGFNSEAFDDKLLAANGFYVYTDYDVLTFTRLAAFGSPDWEDTPDGFSYSLSALAKANGFRKTGSGAIAPKLYQSGQLRQLYAYCLNDVILTYEILKLGFSGTLIDPNTGKYLHFPIALA